MIKSLSVILPTLDEEENLKTLIPNIQNLLQKKLIKEYEILVIDDGSTDNSENLVKQFDTKVTFFKRTEKNSLPMSIGDGVKLSKFKNVMWLDADGSMNISAIESLLDKFSENIDSVIIGSRFVQNGGYKGIEKSGETSFFRAMYNVRKSNDSILATILSKIFNNILYLILPGKVKDLTSGFIVLNKEDVACFSFGKHKGKTVDEVLEKEPGYFGWLLNADFPLYTKKVLTALRLSKFNGAK